MAGDTSMVEQALSNAISKTLEEMSFSEVIKEESKKLDAIKNGVYCASLTVSDPFIGKLSLYMSTSLAEKLTEATFGVENIVPTEEIVLDALREFINTIFGCALAEIVDNDKSFMLGLPNSEVLDSFDVSSVPDAQLYLVDQEYLVLVPEGAALT